MTNSEARKRHATPPTPDALDAIRARVEAATEGPWEAWQNMDAETIVSERGRGRFGVVATPNFGREDYGRADARFIAHARTDVPLLLAALDEALAEQVDLWECPECGFSFDACHTDAGSDDSHSCPACSEAALLIRATAAESARDAAEGAIERVRALAEDRKRHLVRWIDDSHLVDVSDLLEALAPVTTDETEGGGR